MDNCILHNNPTIAAAWRLLDPVMEDIFLSSNNVDVLAHLALAR
jgi:hypothetical protein